MEASCVKLVIPYTFDLVGQLREFHGNHPLDTANNVNCSPSRVARS